MEKDLVSIVLTLYNKKSYIEDTIFSVYQQTYTNRELIILDDWSTDWSFEIAKSFIEKLWVSDKCRLIKNEKNLWLNGNTNKWFKLSNWEYVCILDADDMFVKNKLEKCVEYCNKNSVCLVHSDLCVIDKDNIIQSTTFNTEWHKKNPVKKMIPYGQMTASAIFLHRELANKIIKIWFPGKEVYQDQWINICTALLWYKIWYIKEPLVYYRKVPWNMSSHTNDYSVKGILKNQERFYTGLKTKYTYILNHIETDENFIKYLNKWITLCNLYLNYINGKKLFPPIKLIFKAFDKDFIYFTRKLPGLVAIKILSVLKS